MESNKTINQFNLEDIILRKIQFTINNNIFDKLEYESYNAGELLAYNEMLADINTMYEFEFVTKYIKIIKNLAPRFEMKEITGEKELEKMSGYNNAIVSVLKCLNPVYEYDIEGII